MYSHENLLDGLMNALRHSPTNPPLLRLIGDVLVDMERYDEAGSYYREKLELDPGCQHSRLGLGHSFYGAGRLSEAWVLLDELMTNGQPLPGVFLLKAKLHLSEANPDLQSAQYAYEAAIQANPLLQNSILEKKIQGIDVEEAQEANSDKKSGLFQKSGDDIDAYLEQLIAPRMDFTQVGGMAQVKDEIRQKIILPFRHQSIYEAYGKKAGGGILLYGPPGCGKTHIARATAGEMNGNLISVGIHEILEMWIGKSEKNLHEIFEIARRRTPCVLFFDEADALGSNRSDLKKNGSRYVINQFLSELDGFDAENEDLLILAATNAPWHLDEAFRRPGRFDRIIFVPPPDAEARAAVLEILLEEIDNKEEINYQSLAKKTKDFSGADLRLLIDNARQTRIKEAMETGESRPLNQNDLMRAAKDVRPSTKEWLKKAKNYALFANEGGLYNEILEYLKMNPV